MPRTATKKGTYHWQHPDKTICVMSHNVANKRRKELRKELSLIEKQIYDLETTYLDETREFGNVFSGWKPFLSTEKVKARKTILNEERLFSLSSVTSPASKRTEQSERKQTAGADGTKEKKRKKGDAAQEGGVADGDTS